MSRVQMGRTDQPPSVPAAAGLGWKDFSHAVRTAAVGGNVLLAAASAGLAVWADGVGRYLLGGLLVLSVLLFLGQMAVAGIRLRQRTRLQLLQTRHQEELSAAREEVARATEQAARAAAEAAGNQTLRVRHAAVLAALHEMWLGYPAPYTDDVELTYLIGTSADGDRVIEHRHTTPDRGASTALPAGPADHADPAGRRDGDAGRDRHGDPVRGRPDHDPAGRADREAGAAALHVRLHAEHRRARPAGTRDTGCAGCGTRCAAPVTTG